MAILVIDIKAIFINKKLNLILFLKRVFFDIGLSLTLRDSLGDSC